MREFPLLPYTDKQRLIELVASLNALGWEETVEISSTLAALVSNSILFVNPDQTSTIAIIEEANMVGLVVKHITYEEGERDQVMIEIHNSSVARLYAILDVCGIVQTNSDWMTWFRNQQWGEELAVPSTSLVESGVITTTEVTDGFADSPE